MFPDLRESEQRDSGNSLFQLNLGTAAVYKKFDSVDEATVIASQEDHRFGDFVGFPYASQRYLGGLGLDESLELFVIQTKQVVARGRHHAWADRVYANSFVFEIKRPTPREGTDRSLGSAVYAEGRVTFDACDRRIQDNRRTRRH